MLPASDSKLQQPWSGPVWNLAMIRLVQVPFMQSVEVLHVHHWGLYRRMNVALDANVTGKHKSGESEKAVSWFIFFSFLWKEKYYLIRDWTHGLSFQAQRVWAWKGRPLISPRLGDFFLLQSIKFFKVAFSPDIHVLGEKVSEKNSISS